MVNIQVEFHSLTSSFAGEVPLVNNKHDKYLYASYNLAFDPDDPSTFYVGTWFEGMYKFTDNECVGHYTHLNSPFTYNWALMEDLYE